jgi:hypothetical protein
MSNDLPAISSYTVPQGQPPLLVKWKEGRLGKVLFVVGAIIAVIGLMAAIGSLLPHLNAYALPMQIGALGFLVLGIILMIVGYPLQKSPFRDIAHLVKYQLDVDKGENYLHRFAKEGNVALLQLAIENGCDINAKYEGRTPLYFAIMRENFDCVQLLVDSGADIKSANDRNAPLCRAMLSLTCIMITMNYILQFSKSDIKARRTIEWLETTGKFDFPLNNLVQIASYLIDHGAKIDSKSEESPRDFFYKCLGYIPFMENLTQSDLKSFRKLVPLFIPEEGLSKQYATIVLDSYKPPEERKQALADLRALLASNSENTDESQSGSEDSDSKGSSSKSENIGDE